MDLWVFWVGGGEIVDKRNLVKENHMNFMGLIKSKYSFDPKH